MAEHAHITRRTDPHAAGGRRSLLLAAAPAALLLGGAAAAPERQASVLAQPVHGDAARQSADVHTPHPDAELIAISLEAAPLVAEFERNGAAFFALPPGHPDLDRVASLNDAPSARLDELFDRAAELYATTLPGAAAKARLLQHQMRLQHTMDGELCFDPVSEFAWVLVHDLLRMEPPAALGRA